MNGRLIPPLLVRSDPVLDGDEKIESSSPPTDAEFDRRRLRVSPYDTENTRLISPHYDEDDKAWATYKNNPSVLGVINGIVGMASPCRWHLEVGEAKKSVQKIYNTFMWGHPVYGFSRSMADLVLSLMIYGRAFVRLVPLDGKRLRMGWVVADARETHIKIGRSGIIHYERRDRLKMGATTVPLEVYSTSEMFLISTPTGGDSIAWDDSPVLTAIKKYADYSNASLSSLQRQNDVASKFFAVHKTDVTDGNRIGQMQRKILRPSNAGQGLLTIRLEEEMTPMSSFISDADTSDGYADFVFRHICAAFNFPKELIDPRTATNDGFIKAALAICFSMKVVPMLEMIGDAFTRHLQLSMTQAATPSVSPEVRIVPSSGDSVYMANLMIDRIRGASAGVNTGLLTPNEGRSMVGMSKHASSADPESLADKPFWGSDPRTQKIESDTPLGGSEGGRRSQKKGEEPRNLDTTGTKG